MITIKDIAEICGVSIGTVDRALNNRYGISRQTKNRILQVVKELNYRPDYTARSLSKGRSNTIGVVLFNLHNRSFAQLMDAIERQARQMGFFTDLMLTNKDPELERKSIEYLVSRKADGIILFSVNHGKEFDEYLRKLNKPLITVCNRISSRWKFVGINDRHAMHDAVRYVMNKGYERFIFICPPLANKGKLNIHTQEERLQGCLEALEQYELGDRLIVIQDKKFTQVLETMDLKAGPRTAVLCSTDYYALEVLNFAKEHELDIPRDFGLMGFDNIDVLKFITPSLSTVEYAMEEIGREATRLLITEIETGFSPNVPFLDYKIIPGNSI